MHQELNENMETSIPEIANILRPLGADVFSGKSTLSLSTNNLLKLNEFTENMNEQSRSFHVIESNLKTTRDAQFIHTLFEKTVSLKIYPDFINGPSMVSISNFSNLKTLEIFKIDIHLLVGLQKLRSQLQELICITNLQQFGDILMKCGKDNSEPYSWNELKKAKFTHNNVVQLDNSFDWTLSLHSLDISHNKLSTVNFDNQLPNLKYLNISYNCLTKVPSFKGPICTRLQILVLNNNFIEDLSGLVALVNIVQLELNQNSLIDHGEFSFVSHLVSLQCMSVQNNPLSFHPNHRNWTTSYLNKNVLLCKFSLNGVPLTKSEKGYVGSYYPVSQKLQSNILRSQENTSNVPVQEKPRKIRNVKIKEKSEDNLKAVVPKFTPSPSNDHLQLKKQIEQLREEFGELWLHRHSESIVQEVGEKNLMSSTPIEDRENKFDQTCESNITNFETANSTISQNETRNEEQFETANNSIQTGTDTDSSDGEDVYTSGEECIYLVTNKSDNNQVFVVVTDKFISERDSTTSKEKARWHINTIVKCEKESECCVKLEFNTLRRDRKLRLYELDPSDIEAFYSAVKEKIDMKKSFEKKKSYSCVKCSKTFKRSIENTLTVTSSIACPACDSNLVIEL